MVEVLLLNSSVYIYMYLYVISSYCIKLFPLSLLTVGYDLYVSLCIACLVDCLHDYV